MAEAVREKKPRGSKPKPKVTKEKKSSPPRVLTGDAAGPSFHTQHVSVSRTEPKPFSHSRPATDTVPIAKGVPKESAAIGDTALPSSVVEDSAFPCDLGVTECASGAISAEVEAVAAKFEENVRIETKDDSERVGYTEDNAGQQPLTANTDPGGEQCIKDITAEGTVSETESGKQGEAPSLAQSEHEFFTADELSPSPSHALQDQEWVPGVKMYPSPFDAEPLPAATEQGPEPVSPGVLVSRGSYPRNAPTLGMYTPQKLEIEELLAPSTGTEPRKMGEASAPEPSLESFGQPEMLTAQSDSRPDMLTPQPDTCPEILAGHMDSQPEMSSTQTAGQPTGQLQNEPVSVQDELVNVHAASPQALPAVRQHEQSPEVIPSKPTETTSPQLETAVKHPLDSQEQPLSQTQPAAQFHEQVSQELTSQAKPAMQFQDHPPVQFQDHPLASREQPASKTQPAVHFQKHPPASAKQPLSRARSAVRRRERQPVSASKPPESLPSPTGVKVMALKPMSVDQWENLYYNRELQNNAQFIDNFIQTEDRKTSHEFYEIVMNYRRSRKSLLSVEEDLKTLRQNYERIREELWIVSTKTVTVEGHCADGSKVSKVHSYEQCQLNHDAMANLTSTLQSIRSEMQGDLALFAYSSQMSRLQVESYLHQLFVGCPHLSSMPRNAPVTATEYTREDLQPEVEKLQECISVLFSFHRRPTQDMEFVDNTRKWTERLVAALLRVASYADHLFILNHILRAPAGVGRWAASFVQIPPPVTLPLQSTLGNPVLDHAVTCLATVMLPIKAREEFMCQMRLNVSENSLQMEKAWILVDSDGEEDEDPAQAWLYLHENDLVSVLQQFPLDAIFCHLLQAPMDEHGNVQYDVSRYTEPTMYKLFGFCTIWISLLGAGLSTYSMARYRQLNKRLGRLIRQTIAFVSDHWLNFKTYYKELSAATPLEQLQMEFDQLFMRATYTILRAQKLGSWQFMADMPFTCLSAHSVWQLLWLLQQDLSRSLDLDTLPPYEICKAEMTDMGSSGQLADTLQKLPTSESIYLLTTFANMAAARPLEEDEFIECITLQIFEIAYICDHTRDFCSKTGRELLSSVIQKHPTAFSMLLRRVKAVMPKLGMMSLYLFHGLPSSIWIPQDPDLVLLRQWLLNYDLASAENQLARVVLDRMNWDVFVETGKLVLDIRIHRQVALLLYEAYTKFIPERRASYFIVEGMRQMASYVSQQSSREQQFSNWVWNLALRLKLHRESAILHSKAAESQPFSPVVIDERDPIMLPILMAAEARHPLGCFLVLSMSQYGHQLTYFMGGGLNMLMSLASSSQFSTVIHILSCIVPYCMECPDYLLENETFQKILQMVLAADENVLRVTKMVLGAEFPGTVTKQFTQMLQAMISSRLGSEAGLPVLLFWVRAIFKVSRFLSDQNCCYVLDNLVQWGYLLKGARAKLDEAFREYFKQLVSESPSKSSGGGLLSLFGSGGGSQPSLMEKASLPDFGWLASQILAVEEAHEMESGVWPSLQHDLLAHPNLAVENAVKPIVTRLKLTHAPTVWRLSIYRWAQQALDMPVDHPMLPVVWQKFFSLYLGRPAVNTQLPARASVGERFFRSTSMSSMLKRMKKRLSEAEKFHVAAVDTANTKAAGASSDESVVPQPSAPRDGEDLDTPLPSPTREENQKYVVSEEFHQQLASLYRTYSLWLEEPRLHGGDLYLPALPPQYNASRLMHIFMAGNSSWLEFVDFDGVQYNISLSAAEWRKLLSCQPQQGSTSSPAHSRNAFRLGERTAKQRILQRLHRYASPQPPPSLHPLAPPVPDIPSSLLLDKAAVIHLLNADLSVLTEFTKVFSTRAAQQCAIDAAYLDLIPKQWSNNQKQITVAAECRSRVNPLHKCAGPAAIPVRIEERTVNSITQRKMDENRAEYKQLVIEAVLPPPQNVCVAAVHVENAITLLIKMAQNTTDRDRRAGLLDLACTLFYHLTMQVTEETDFYPPTKQFFASCVEILGQEFVSRAPEQAPLLLQFCLDNPSLASVVSPHFVPNNAPQNFVSMYEQLITVLQQQDLNLVFMLLTKFDVSAWLEECRPHAADKKRFLEVLGSALMSCGAEPTSRSKLVFDLYLAHLRCMLRHQFPANLSSVLILLLQGSGTEDLHTSCWEMLLAECCAAASGAESRPSTSAFSPERVEICSDIPLSTKDLQDMLGWLGAWFMHQRATDKDMANFGLYPRWGRYVPYVALLLGLLSRSFVAKVLKSMQEDNPFEAMHMVWVQQLDLWRAWMEPLAASTNTTSPREGPEMFEPWTEGDSTVAVTMVSAFRTTLMFTHMTLANTAPQFSSTVFSLLLMHYMTSLCHRMTPGHVTDVLVAEFRQLPWAYLKPDLQLLETMAQLKERCASPCFQLIGHIITKVGWAQVHDYFLSLPDPQQASRQQGALLVLFVQCFGDPATRETPEILQVLTAAENFNWSCLTVEMYRKASLWFLQVCPPQALVAPRTSLHGLGLRLMRSAAEFTKEASVVWRPDMSLKRHLYVHCMTQQLCQMTYLSGVERRDVEIALMNFLAEIEVVESAVPDARCQEEESLDLMKEVLNLLNNSNPDGDWQTSILHTLQDWLKASNSVLLLPGVKAASRCLASLSQMAIVTESCIEGYFMLSMRELEEQRKMQAELTCPAEPEHQPQVYPTLPADPSCPLFPDSSPPHTYSAPINLGTQLVAERGWTPVLASLQVPELNLKQYIDEALGCGAYLTLHALILHKRALCQSVTDEARLMEEVLDWSARAQPSTNEEAKMLLWWYEFLDMWLHQINCGASLPMAVNSVQRLVAVLQQLGEDRATTGFLSVIGFGRKSVLSTEFRLAVRTLAAFLSSQILSETIIRFDPSNPLSDLPVGKQCRQALTGLRTSRTYADLKDDVHSLCSFVSATENTARNALDLVKELAQRLFSESSYLFDPLGWARDGFQGRKHVE